MPRQSKPEALAKSHPRKSLTSQITPDLEFNVIRSPRGIHGWQSEPTDILFSFLVLVLVLVLLWTPQVRIQQLERVLAMKLTSRANDSLAGFFAGVFRHQVHADTFSRRGPESGDVIRSPRGIHGWQSEPTDILFSFLVLVLVLVLLWTPQQRIQQLDRVLP